MYFFFKIVLGVRAYNNIFFVTRHTQTEAKKKNGNYRWTIMNYFVLLCSFLRKRRRLKRKERKRKRERERERERENERDI